MPGRQEPKGAFWSTEVPHRSGLAKFGPTVWPQADRNSSRAHTIRPSAATVPRAGILHFDSFAKRVAFFKMSRAIFARVRSDLPSTIRYDSNALRGNLFLFRVGSDERQSRILARTRQ
jgi:hypothetical protein